MNSGEFKAMKQRALRATGAADLLEPPAPDVVRELARDVMAALVEIAHLDADARAHRKLRWCVAHVDDFDALRPFLTQERVEAYLVSIGMAKGAERATGGHWWMSGEDEKRMTMPGRPHRSWAMAHHDIAWNSGVTDTPIDVLVALLPDVGPWSAP